MTPVSYLIARGWHWDIMWWTHPRYGRRKFTFRQAVEMEMENG